MAINFTDSPSNGATQTISGRTYTYNSAKNKWDTTATEVTGPTATVYASVDNLPTSGNITGSQAFVSGTNRLYIWNGSGWYNIALINNTPTISGANASYTLAIDGTATTVTLVATDPEGLPITYSIASDTSGNTATVTQGTGSNTNVFTITPSTNTAHAGTFSLTFRASDGVNLATAVSSFTLQFAVQNSRYTTALITSVGANNAVNNSFDDKSSNDYSMTVNGDTHHCGMSPYRPGGYSTYFDGTGDYLTVSSHASMSLDADFTIEYWVYNPTSGNNWFFTLGDAKTATGFETYIGSSGSQFILYAGDSSRITSSTKPTVNAWSHVAVVRSSSTITLYLNGVSLGTWSSSATFSGNAYISAEYYNGAISSSGNNYLTDVRIVKGTAVYTSNFTPTTERLTAITNTSLLTCHLPYIADGSTNAHSITINGGTHTLPFAPYDAQEYTNSSHLGSVHFDGTGDSLSFTTTGDLQALGRTGTECTVEGWVYLYSYGSNGTSLYAQGTEGSTGGSNIYEFGIKADGKVRAHVNGAYTNETGDAISTGTVPTRVWTHLAYVLYNQTWTVYINGKADGTGTGSYPSGTTHNAGWIGRMHYDAARTVTMNLSDLRVNATQALYTSNFTPPTSPLSTTSNTVLHMPMADGGIIDKAQTTNTLKLYGNAKSSTSYTKYLTSSIYLDGTGDYIDIAPAFSQFFDFGTLPFTVEFWMYLTAVDGERIILESRAGHTDAGLLIMLNSGVMKNLTSGAVRTTGGTTITANTWYHVAVVRDGTSLRTYLNGTEESGSASYTSAVTAPFSKFRLGARFDGANPPAGYFSDVRITKGLARYTSNFTAPTAALKG